MYFGACPSVPDSTTKSVGPKNLTYDWLRFPLSKPHGGRVTNSSLAVG